MKVCLLYLSVLTLLQLHSRYVISANNDIWLPSIRKLASMIQSCEYAVYSGKSPERSYENYKEFRSSRPGEVNINSRVLLNNQETYESGIQTSSHLGVDVRQDGSRYEVDIPQIQEYSSNVRIPAFRTIRINVGDQSIRNLNYGEVQQPPKPRTRSNPYYVQVGANNIRNSITKKKPQVPSISNVVSINNENRQEDKILPRARSVGINVGHDSTKNLNNVHDDSVYYLNRLRTLSKDYGSLDSENEQEDNILPRSRPVGINVGHDSTKNLNNVHDDSVYYLNRLRTLSKDYGSLDNENKQEDNILPRSRPVGINIGHDSSKNLNNVRDDSVFYNNRLRTLSKGYGGPKGYGVPLKTRTIAACVKSRLIQAYEEERHLI